MSETLKRFVESLRGLFSNPGHKDPLTKISDIEPVGAEDSLESEENTFPPVVEHLMEREVET